MRVGIAARPAGFSLAQRNVRGGRLWERLLALLADGGCPVEQAGRVRARGRSRGEIVPVPRMLCDICLGAHAEPQQRPDKPRVIRALEVVESCGHGGSGGCGLPDQSASSASVARNGAMYCGSMVACDIPLNAAWACAASSRPCATSNRARA